MHLYKKLLVIFLVLFITAACESQSRSSLKLQDSIGPITVEIVETDSGFKLLRGGEPYLVNGAGLNSPDIEQVKSFGGNSVRTWAVDDHAEPAQQLLDRAYALGMTVSLCLEFARERQGFNYDDPKAVAKQLEENRDRVLRYKDHPALLTWIIGNEVNFDYSNPKVFDAVNETAEMIKELDPHHPTTTALAGYDRRAVKDINERAPALDFISFQMYADVVNLPKYIKEDNFTGPYFVTEWGSVGHWEVRETKWGAPIENTSTEKAENYTRSYEKVLKPYANTAIGNYVFLWGQKQEKTSTWYGMFLDSGEKTEVVDVMQYIWTGQYPDNRAPSITPITIDGKSPFKNLVLAPNHQHKAEVEVNDPDGDDVRFMWEIRKETTSRNVGGDKEYVPQLVHVDKSEHTEQVKFMTPDEPGAYRLYVFAYDGNGNAAHANFPFYVES